MPSQLKCQECDQTFAVPPSRRHTARFCSNACARPHRGQAKKRVMLECKHCGDMFEALQCHSFRRSYCSNECRESAPDYIKAKMMRLRGSRNPAWKGGRQRQSNGYVYLVRPEHPFADQTGRILEHRLVMEEWLRLNEPNSLFLTKLGSQKYLRPEFIVHHKDEVKSNNVIENLECMTKPQHALLHNAGAKEKAASA